MFRSRTDPDAGGRLKGSHWARAGAVLLVLVLLVVAAGAGARIVLLRGARKVMDHWSESGFPGPPPHGSGPYADVGWPPRVSWESLDWGEHDQVRLSCRRVDLVISPWDLLRGRMRLHEVRVQDLHVSGPRPIRPWTDAIISSLADTTTAPVLERRPSGSIVFDVGPVSFDDSPVRLARVNGWGWAPRSGAWAVVARAMSGTAASMTLRGSGFGAAGSGEVDIDASPGAGRALRVHGRHPVRQGWTWDVSGRDDGALASILLANHLPLAPAPRGDIDFEFRRQPERRPSGEAVLRDVRFDPGTPGGGDWTMNGQICLNDSELTIQQCEAASGSNRLRFDASFPLADDSSSEGSCVVSAVIGGSGYRLNGTVRRRGSGYLLQAPCIDTERARTGRAEIEFDPGAPRGSRVSARVRFGSGCLYLQEPAGSGANTLLVHGSSIPIASLQPWLPFRAAGEWSGVVDGDAILRSGAEGWRWIGTASIAGVRIRGVPLLEQIASLRGSERGGSVRFDRVSTRWSYGPGRFLADSLLVRSRTMTVQGCLYYMLPDSLLGLLQVSPGEGDALSSIVRLLGGSRMSLDLGIAGSAEGPGITVLTESTRAHWRERLESVRRSNDAS